MRDKIDATNVTASDIIAQAMTMYYQWAKPEGLNSDSASGSYVRLFQLLRAYDDEAMSKVFNAATRGEDFPPDVDAKYPLEDVPIETD